MEEVMLRNLAFARRLCRGSHSFSRFARFRQLNSARQRKPKAMLERAFAAVKEDKAKALDMFQKGEGGFNDFDLYVWCATDRPNGASYE
jgi:hypothetical protein